MKFLLFLVKPQRREDRDDKMIHGNLNRTAELIDFKRFSRGADAQAAFR